MRTFILIGCCVMLTAGPALAADPTGDWLVENGSGQVRIENCGGALWGVVSWESAPGRDTNNPDPALRSRPTLGLPLLLDMRTKDQERWEGHVYNVENGKTYDANIKLVNPNVLRIEGCVLGGIFCGGQNWTRVAPPAAPAAGTPNPQTRGGPPQAKGPAPKAAPGAPVSEVCSRVSNLPGGAH
jgi:uncharacterized protein (DUF2147 family)